MRDVGPGCPGVIAHPGPPHIQTCGYNASDVSSHEFATSATRRHWGGIRDILTRLPDPRKRADNLAAESARVRIDPRTVLPYHARRSGWSNPRAQLSIVLTSPEHDEFGAGLGFSPLPRGSIRCARSCLV